MRSRPPEPCGTRSTAPTSSRTSARPAVAPRSYCARAWPTTSSGYASARSEATPVPRLGRVGSLDVNAAEGRQALDDDPSGAWSSALHRRAAEDRERAVDDLHAVGHLDVDAAEHRVRVDDHLVRGPDGIGKVDVHAPEGRVAVHLRRRVPLASERRAAEEADLDECCLLYTSPSPRDGLLSRMPS